jgi:hypothetical protein
MCPTLDIRIVAAHSALASTDTGAGLRRAPGSADPENGRKKIGTHQSGQFLQEDPGDPTPICAGSGRATHRTITPQGREWEQVFGWEAERNISTDWVVRYANRYSQLSGLAMIRPRQEKVTVSEREDGRI